MGRHHGRRPVVSFYVQHLLGIGHLARAFRIAAALVEDGWEVEMLVGGELPPGFATGAVPVVQLPPVRALPGGLSTLVHPDGRVFDIADQNRRRDLVLARVGARRPDVLMIEAFPFGRRQMRFELLPLLDAVRVWPEPPLVAASVRDILQESHRPERTEETVAILDRFFDQVLVHGDPALIRLEASYPAAARFAEKVSYTGLVAPAAPRSAAWADVDVVVSAGGGAVGDALLSAALAARPATQAANLRWLVLTGPNLPPETVERLQRARGGGVRLERFVPDLAGLLAGARLSISQAGYNTVADILVAGCRAVLVPYARDGETEQTRRSDLLAAAGRVAAVAEADLTPLSLATAIDAALAVEVDATSLDLDGARQTASLLRALLARRGQPRS